MGDIKYRARVDYARLGGAARDIGAKIVSLIDTRAPDATVCPSEIARALVVNTGVTDWREMMPRVHAAVDQLLLEGLISLSWKGQTLDERHGPYRIARGRMPGPKKKV